MDSYTVFPDQSICAAGTMSVKFLELGIERFHQACGYVHALPYGYNSDRDDVMILFKEGLGSCTTKHAVIATLAQELGLPIGKRVGIYRMTEAIVTGTRPILDHFALPYVPMVHCFLQDDGSRQPHRVDLTEGNRNGKNRPVDHFLHEAPVSPTISAREEYLLYRRALTGKILLRDEFVGVDVQKVLKAREQAIALLRSKVS